jgi:hypothetical protein
MTRTFQFHPVRRRFLGAFFVAFGASCFVPTVGLFIPGFYKGSNTEPTAGEFLLACVVGLAFAWYGIRYLRWGVQVSGQKLTIRNDLRTYTVDAADIRAITLQPKRPANKDWGPYWATRVELTNGKSIWIGNFDCGPAGRPPRPERVAIVEEVRALLGLRDADFSAETR